MAAKRRTPSADRKKAKKTVRRPAKPPRAERDAPRIDDRVERIQRVIDVMKAAGAVEVEMEDTAGKLRIRLKEDAPPAVWAPAGAPLAAPPPAAPAPREGAPAAAPGAEEAERPAGEVFKSPMVGTFYRAPSPDAEPFVKVGDHVTPDTTLCIIEAMKVMNEIKADLEGEIVDILVQNGEAVDFGQPLFVIRTA